MGIILLSFNASSTPDWIDKIDHDTSFSFSGMTFLNAAVLAQQR